MDELDPQNRRDPGVPVPNSASTSNPRAMTNRRDLDWRSRMARALKDLRKHNSPARRIAIASIASLVGAIAFGAMFLQPEKYFAKTTVELPGAHFPPSRPSYFQPEPQDLPTQFQTWRKRRILEAVVDEFDLTKAFAKNGHPISLQDASAQLDASLEFHPIPNTGRLEISTYQRDPRLAAGIVNALVAQYRKDRLTRMQESKDKALAQMRDEVEKRRQKMEQSKREMEDFAKRSQIIDPDPETMSTKEGCRG